MKKTPTIQYTCDECSLGTYDMKFENLSIYGEPTLIACPFSERKRVLTEPACKKIQLKGSQQTTL